MPRRTTRGSIAKASAKAKKNNTTTNLRKKQASEALLDISDEASVESIIEVTTPTMSKRKTRGYIGRKLINKAANISLSPNVNISKKQIGEDLLDTSDEESVKSIIEATTPTTPSISKETASTTTSPSSISSMSTMVSWIYNYFLTSLIIILTSLSLML